MVATSLGVDVKWNYLRLIVCRGTLADELADIAQIACVDNDILDSIGKLGVVWLVKNGAGAPWIKLSLCSNGSSRP